MPSVRTASVHASASVSGVGTEGQGPVSKTASCQGSRGRAARRPPSSLPSRPSCLSGLWSRCSRVLPAAAPASRPKGRGELGFFVARGWLCAAVELQRARARGDGRLPRPAKAKLWARGTRGLLVGCRRVVDGALRRGGFLRLGTSCRTRRPCRSSWDRWSCWWSSRSMGWSPCEPECYRAGAGRLSSPYPSR